MVYYQTESFWRIVDRVTVAGDTIHRRKGLQYRDVVYVKAPDEDSPFTAAVNGTPGINFLRPCGEGVAGRICGLLEVSRPVAGLEVKVDNSKSSISMNSNVGWPILLLL